MSAVTFDYVPQLASTFDWPTNRGVFALAGVIPLQRQALPTDPIGTLTITLSNIVTGSVIQVETTSGITVLNVIADNSIETLIVQVYSSGSHLNNLIIKIRKGSSAPYYRPWDTLVTAISGSQSIYVSQIPD